jgi:hypothetical protein
VLSLFVGTSALAAESVIKGTARDASTHNPVPDVVVTATSPGLQGEQVVVTDASGEFYIPQLPVGLYTLRFEKESYHPLSRGGINLQVSQTLQADVELLPEAIQSETIEVVGQTPVIDVGSSTTGGTISSDFVNNIAVARPTGTTGAGKSFESLAATLPQTAGDQFGVSINGATSPENSYQIDGMSTNHVGYNFNASPLSFEFIDEVNVITGGYMPEFGRTQGGAINAVTKSGGNEFHGSIWGDWSPGALAATPPRAPNVSTSYANAIAKVWNIGDFGVTLGGPILKDKLWFFAGIQPSFSRYQDQGYLQYVNGTYGDTTTSPVTPNGFGVGGPYNGYNFVPNGTVSPIPGSDLTRFADQREIQYIAKLTYLLNADNRISLSYTGTPRWSGGGNSLPFFDTADASGPPGGGVFNGVFPSALGGETKESSGDLNLKWNGAFLTKKLLIDATFGWHHETASNLPADGQDWSTSPNSSAFINQLGASNLYYAPLSNYGIALPAGNQCGTPPAPGAAPSSQVYTNQCLTSGYAVGGGNVLGFLDQKQGDAFQLNVHGTYLLHWLGHHVIKAGFDGTYGIYQDTAGYPGSVALINYGTYYAGVRGFGELYGPDAFQLFRNVNDVTTKYSIVGGFIQDSWSVMDLVTANIGVRYDDETIYNNAGDAILALPNQWAPRVGAVYDPTQSGKAKLFANYSLFYQNVPLDMADREIAGIHEQGQPGFFNGYVPGAGCNPNSPSTCVPNPGQPSPGTPNSPGSTNPSQLWYGYNQNHAMVDPNVSAPSSNQVVAGGEYEIMPNGRVGAVYTHSWINRVLEDFSPDNGATLLMGNPGYGIGNYLPAPTRNYDAVTVSFSKNFSDHWLAQVSYTWSQLKGNYNGFYLPQTGGGTPQLDPGITAMFDLRQFVYNSNGYLDSDTTHFLKAFASKEFVLGNGQSINLGLSYQGHSGTPTSYIGWSSLYQQPLIYIAQRGAGPRTPWVNDFDGKISYNYQVAKNSTLTFSVDVFNLFNWQTATDVNQAFTLESANGAAYQPQSLRPPNNTSAQIAGCFPGASGGCKIVGTNGETWNSSLYYNPNFGKPEGYQAPRLVRFGVRLTF